MSVEASRGLPLYLRVGGHVVSVDRSPDDGGHGGGPTPVELLVGAVASSAGEAARTFLEQGGRAQLLEVGCHYEMEAGHPSCIQLTLRLDRPIDAADQAGLLRATHRDGLTAALLLPVQMAVAAAVAEPEAV